MKKLPSGKLPGGGCKGQQPPLATLGPQSITVASVTSNATVITGEVGCSKVKK